MLNTNNDNSDRFSIGKVSFGYVNLLLCLNLQDKRYIFILL